MIGRIVRISGPLVVADNMSGSLMYEVVRVGEEGLIGEVIRIQGDLAMIQVYEDTTGLKPGEKVERTGSPLSVELGPGIIGTIYDGIQRPLEVIRDKTGTIFIRRGVTADSLDRNKKWHFIPKVKRNDDVEPGDIIGIVQETSLVEHRILVPPNVRGRVIDIVSEGDYTIEDIIATIETKEGKYELKMYQKWPVRVPRPFKEKLDPTEPLITGQRVIDCIFPVAKGGTAAVPGPFGAGKTVLGHQLAKWSDAEVFIYIGCGERGNEMTEVLEEFPHLKEPRTGKPLMERTILIANTSNMPVAAREASIYVGITIAEYFRDMGYNVALMADSTSRWAEAMREISGRLEEMPGEEGFPAYLASRLSEFYERAGRVICLGKDNRIGSVTVVGAVSPPGGDFTEPVTQNTLRIVKVFWGLDSKLADRRHFPAINWLISYSLYVDHVKDWWHRNISDKWLDRRNEAMKILQREAELLEIVQLVGPEALPERDRWLLEAARMIREDFLQQNAFHEVDTYCSPKKQFEILDIIITFYHKGLEAISRGVPFKKLAELEVKSDIAMLKYIPENEFDKVSKEIRKKIDEQIEKIMKEVEVL